MKLFQLFLLAVLLCTSVFAEVRVWIGEDGQRIEGTFKRELLGRIQIRDTQGKLHLIPLEKIAKSDLNFLQKNIVPEVEIQFRKNSVLNPEMEWTIPRDKTTLYTCTITIDKESDMDSKVQLTVELYLIAEELDGDNWVLQSYDKKRFMFPEGKESSFEFTVKDVGFRRYEETWGGQTTGTRGENYLGYLIVILDGKGRLAEYKTDLDNEPWLRNDVSGAVEKLRALAIEGRGSKYSRHFDVNIKKRTILPIRWWQRFGGP